MSSEQVHAYGAAMVMNTSRLVHVARGAGRRAVRICGARVEAAYNRRMYPSRIERPATEALALLDATAAESARNHVESARPKVVHIIGSLVAGGAERQLATFVAASQRTGAYAHEVLTIHPPEGAKGHFRPLLEDAMVPLRWLDKDIDHAVVARIKSDQALRERLLAIPPVLGFEPVEIVGELLAIRPDIVHAWLDHTNIFGGVGALAAGVPQVVLGLRSMSPPHFPAWYQDWMLPWYQALAAHPRVSIVANSRVGADDYARWMGIESSRIGVIANGFDPLQFPRPDDATIAAVRAEIGATNRPLVIGVFRVCDEKKPHHFVQVGRKVLARVPDAVFAIAGDGPMLEEIARASEDLGDSLRLLGRRSDVATLLAAADAMLTCSRVEGLPNACIEAQALGCPVVATDAGGTRETIDPSRSGFLRPVGDVTGLAHDLVTLLADPSMRLRFSAAARTFSRDGFGLNATIDQVHALYASVGNRR